MAVIAGVLLVVAGFRMAGGAACVMIAIKRERVIVIEGCRFPRFCGVAGKAVFLGETVQGVCGFLLAVAGHTLFLLGGTE